MKDFITLVQGSGGKEMGELIKSYGFDKGKWKNTDDDSATYDLGDKKLIFTSDSFIVDPVFFPGGDIGHIAFCGTVNDLAVMGATPIGLSLALIIEEGFPKDDLIKILTSIKELSKKTGIPIVTGDTKVMQKGMLDKITINTSGVGLADTILDKKPVPGDKIILSGGLGEHAVALLSKRCDYSTDTISDSKPIVDEIKSIRELIKIAKDPTRGGLAATLNEICEKNKSGMRIIEDTIPVKEEVQNVCNMLGINLYELACEGRFVCIAETKNAKAITELLPDAVVIGEITEGNKVIVKTELGERVLPMPTGRIVPRIC